MRWRIFVQLLTMVAAFATVMLLYFHWKLGAPVTAIAVFAILTASAAYTFRQGMAQRKKDALRCSFCGRPQKDVQRLMAGSGKFSAAYICEQCVEMSATFMGECDPDWRSRLIEKLQKMPQPLSQNSN